MVVTRKVSGKANNKKLTPTPSAKKAKISSPETIVSSSDDDLQAGSQDDIVETSSISNPKKLLVERSVDLTLFEKSIVPLFQALSLEVLLKPPEVVYPKLVEEFYANLKVTDSVFVSSVVKGKSIMFEPNYLGFMLGIHAPDGICPFTSHKPFTEFSGLSHSIQLKLVTDIPSFPEKTLPTPQQLTPLAFVLFRIIHSNVCPRSSGKDRVSNQDLILIALLLSSTHFSFPRLMISHMAYSSSHRSMCLPYAGLLSTVFLFHKLVSGEDVSEPTVGCFDENFLYSNRIAVDTHGQLLFLDIKSEEPPQSPSRVFADNSNVFPEFISIDARLNSFLETQVRIESFLKSIFPAYESGMSKGEPEVSLSKIQNGIVHLDETQKLLSGQIMGLESKVNVLQELVSDLDRPVSLDYRELHQALSNASRLWESDFVKLFKRLSGEIAFVSRQAYAIQPLAHESAVTWKKHLDWLFMEPTDRFPSSVPTTSILPATFVEVPEDLSTYVKNVQQKPDDNAGK